jgi:hypothetical protein
LLFGKEVRGFTRTKPLEDTAMKVAPGDSAELGVLTRAVHVAREPIALHGGIGVTENLSLGAGLCQVKAMSAIYSDEDIQLNQRALGSLTGVYT